MFVRLLKHLVPLPYLENHDIVMVVGPHPDDIEIGAGASVNKLIRLGKRVVFVIATDGSAGSMDAVVDEASLAKTRRAEAIQGALQLGVTTVEFLDFPDGGMYKIDDLAVKLAALIVKYDPNLIICPDPLLPSEIHPDHLKCGAAVQTAFIMAGVPNLLKREGIPFELPLHPNRTLAFYYTHRPNRCVRLEQVDREAQKRAIGAHVSQYPGYGDVTQGEMIKMLFQYITLRSKRFGLKILARDADGFFVMKGIQTHCFPEVNEY